MAFDLFSFLVPKDRTFFPLFDKASANVEEAGKAIFALITTTDLIERERYIRLIEEIEHKGDELTHHIFEELGRNFITPFDREDIHRLTTTLDDVLDFIHGSSKRIELYNMTQYSSAMVKLCSLIQIQTEELRLAILGLKTMDSSSHIKNAILKVNSLENHADDIFENALARLFETETNAIELIKVKEVLSMLETTTDRCEDVANVVESIYIKMA